MQEEQFGRYVLLSRLGYGGMAEVFLARTDGIGGFEKKLAIKRLLPYYTEDEQTVELLADEAKITVRLAHPNIVQVFDFGRIDNDYFIAMEYIDGLDLKSLVEIDEYSSEPMQLHVALFVTIAVLEALDYAHERADDYGNPLNIIHRDVSPQNVLISRHGQVKLTDFGVARAAIQSHVSIIGDIRGKFSYMPPEQACGGEIDQRVDLFAAGAILYELLTGRQPYRSASSGQQMAQLNQQVTLPTDLRPDLPSGLDVVMLRALARDPEDRFESAREFANSLGGLLDLRGDPLGPQRALAALVERRLAHDSGNGRQHQRSAGATRAGFTPASAPAAAGIRSEESPQRSVSGELVVADVETTQETKVALPSRWRGARADQRASGSDGLLGKDSATDTELENRALTYGGEHELSDPGRPPADRETMTDDHHEPEPLDATLVRVKKPIHAMATRTLVHRREALPASVALGLAPTQLLNTTDLQPDESWHVRQTQPLVARDRRGDSVGTAASPQMGPHGAVPARHDAGGSPRRGRSNAAARSDLAGRMAGAGTDRRRRFDELDSVDDPVDTGPPGGRGRSIPDSLRRRPLLFYGVVGALVMLIGVLIGVLVAIT